MKKLNRKGFTLVEWLAVIIILAVVVGITIPAILTTTGNAKKKAAQNAANVSADWFDRQYQSYLIGDPTLSQCDSDFKNTFIDANNKTERLKLEKIEVSEVLIQKAGLSTKNVSKMEVTFNEYGRSCVIITAKAGGDYPSGETAQGGNC